jgi:hypothetical protein
MKKQLIIEIAAGLLILLFVYTGLTKLIGYNEFSKQLARLPIVSSNTNVVGILLPSTELLIAVFLLWPRMRFWGFCLSATALLTFIIYILIILHTDAKLPCACGGAFKFLSWSNHIKLNTLFFIIAVTGAILQYGHSFHLSKKQDTSPFMEPGNNIV